MSWDIKALRTDVRRVFGRDQEDLLTPCCSSVQERLDYAAFHYAEAVGPLRDYLEGRDGGDRLLLDLVFDPPVDVRQMRWVAGAHMTAALQSLHAVGDTLGHVLYFALGMNLSPVTKLPDHRVDLKLVAEKIGDAQLRALVLELRDCDDFRYLTDIVNHSKHRSVVKIATGVDMQSDRPPGLQFMSFRRMGKAYPSRWVADYFPSEFNRQGPAVLAIGRRLNNLLSAM